MISLAHHDCQHQSFDRTETPCFVHSVQIFAADGNAVDELVNNMIADGLALADGVGPVDNNDVVQAVATPAGAFAVADQPPPKSPLWVCCYYQPDCTLHRQQHIYIRAIHQTATRNSPIYSLRNFLPLLQFVVDTAVNVVDDVQEPPFNLYS